MPDYKSVEDIENKIHKVFTKSLKNKGFTNFSTGMIKDKRGKIRFFEVILNDRNQRHSNPSIMKKIPKTYKGIKVKAF